jgi:hypothetical protein
MAIVAITLLLLSGNMLLYSQGMANWVYAPKTYSCIYAGKEAQLKMDGDLTEKVWEQATWTTSFTDIEGQTKPEPYLDTKVKMVYDDEYLYIGAQLMESHLWATYDKQDMVIFEENNFEVFIDTDGDTHHYTELEINALGTIWDLMLTKPYRNFGIPISHFEIKGLKKGVKCFGTLNNPSDRDEKWTLELAIPWSDLYHNQLHKVMPAEGEAWKINFSRVQWDRDIKDGKYIKQKDTASGKIKPENNWVWSSQGVINMHRPETWGLIVFCKKPDEKLIKAAIENDQIKWQLRKIFYQEEDFYRKNGIYTTKVQTDLSQSNLEIKVIGDTYTVKYCKNRSCWYLREDSRIWEVKK